MVLTILKSNKMSQLPLTQERVTEIWMPYLLPWYYSSQPPQVISKSNPFRLNESQLKESQCIREGQRDPAHKPLLLSKVEFG